MPRALDPNLRALLRAQAAAHRRQLLGNVATSVVQASAVNPMWSAMLGMAAGAGLSATADLYQGAAEVSGLQEARRRIGKPDLDLMWTRRTGVAMMALSGVDAAGSVASNILEALSPGGSSTRQLTFDIPDVPAPGGELFAGVDGFFLPPVPRSRRAERRAPERQPVEDDSPAPERAPRPQASGVGGPVPRHEPESGPVAQVMPEAVPVMPPSPYPAASGYGGGPSDDRRPQREQISMAPVPAVLGVPHPMTEAERVRTPGTPENAARLSRLAFGPGQALARGAQALARGSQAGARTLVPGTRFLLQGAKRAVGALS